MTRSRLVLAAFAGGLALLGAFPGSEARAQGANPGWLAGAENDAQRFQRLERDLGGFGRAMLEASIRYERLYSAVQRGNYELATAYWEGIKGSIESGIIRRPGRAKNAQEYLLSVKWGEIDNAFKSRDPAIAKAGFMKARTACMGCREAEKRAFLNGQPMFDDLVFK